MQYSQICYELVSFICGNYMFINKKMTDNLTEYISNYLQNLVKIENPLCRLRQTAPPFSF